MDNQTETDDVGTQPPARTADGVTLHNGYPLNRRLRAEALADAGETTDADELVDDELIAETKDRLERERAEAQRIADREAKAHPTVAESMLRSDLVKIAKREGATFETDANKDAIVASIEAHRLATQGG